MQESKNEKTLPQTKAQKFGDKEDRGGVEVILFKAKNTEARQEYIKDMALLILKEKIGDLQPDKYKRLAHFFVWLYKLERMSHNATPKTRDAVWRYYILGIEMYKEIFQYVPMELLLMADLCAVRLPCRGGA